MTNAEKVIAQFDNAKSWDAVCDMWDSGETYIRTYYTADGDIPEDIPEEVYLAQECEIECLQTLMYASKEFWDEEILEAEGTYNEAAVWEKHMTKFVEENAKDIAREIERRKK